MHTFDISIENLSKIEGHTDLDIVVKDNKVQDVKLKISENKRFYTQAIRGKHYLSAPQLMSRICGTCSIAHLMCCIEAIENALNVKNTKQTKLLKRLTMNGLMIRDHGLHLYIFAMPDLFEKDSILQFDENNEVEHQLVHDCFDVKAAGNYLCQIVAGRAVHATYPTIGGFSKFPKKEEIREAIKKLENIREKVIRLIKVFYDCKFKFERKTHFVALGNVDYNFLDGEIHSSEGLCTPEALYYQHLEKFVIPYSQAIGFTFDGKEYMIGALARVNLNKDKLHKKTREDAAEYLKVFPSEDIFHNNLAQAIEMLHCIDDSIEILSDNEFVEEPKAKPEIKKGIGVGVIEAPRGTLYYEIELDDQGKITNANLAIPTGQNQVNMEKDIAKVVQDNIDKDKEEIKMEVEKLIRAYDPCMSCATHFLKINWL